MQGGSQMKFRWRGGTRGYFVRGYARARRRAYREGHRADALDSCTAIILLLLVAAPVVLIAGFVVQSLLTALFKALVSPLTLFIGLFILGCYILWRERATLRDEISRLLKDNPNGTT